MKRSYIEQNCKYFYRRASRYNCGCKCCKMSIKQSRESWAIYKNHTPGKRCKFHNNCSQCSAIKGRFREIMHIAYKGKKCGKRCEYCKGNCFYPKHISAKDIYRMFFRRYRWKFQLS